MHAADILLSFSKHFGTVVFIYTYFTLCLVVWWHISVLKALHAFAVTDRDHTMEYTRYTGAYTHTDNVDKNTQSSNAKKKAKTNT